MGSHADLIRESLPCSVELPAGTGKTETIASLVGLMAREGKRSLVLTHTHAGVDALRRRMTKHGVPRAAVTIRTLDGWCFDLIAHFPDLSGIAVGPQPDWAQSMSYHRAGARAAATAPVARMLSASYELAVVDEYQDCQLWQHDLVSVIAATVPTCVFGDRMQGLFFFGKQQPVLWHEVTATFPPLDLDVIPWRWRDTDPELGAWLLDVRRTLLDGGLLDVSGSPVRLAHPDTTRSVLYGMPRPAETVVAISRFPRSAARLASSLGGRYTMIEELEGKHLRKFAEFIDGGNPATVARETVQYTIECANGIAEVIPSKARKNLGSGAAIRAGKAIKEAPGAVAAVNAVLVSPDASTVRAALRQLSQVPGFKLFRREAWFGILDALRLCEATPGLAAVDAVDNLRNQLRTTGRRPEARIVGRALLVKGLEFDHAVIESPGECNAHELYVCLTRGSRSVTLMSEQTQMRVFRPQRASQ